MQKSSSASRDSLSLSHFHFAKSRDKIVITPYFKFMFAPFLSSLPIPGMKKTRKRGHVFFWWKKI